MTLRALLLGLVPCAALGQTAPTEPAPVPSIPPGNNQSAGVPAPAERVAPPITADRVPDAAGPPASTPNSGAPDQSSPTHPR